jgi:hypothetical protein
MVAPATSRLGYVPHVNLSRCFLHRAYDALQAGKLFEAGCLLRESIRRQLFAECAWKGCLPKKFSDRTSPLALLKALRSAGHCSDCGYDWTLDIIALGNTAAHCGHVDPGTLRSAIGMMHVFIDGDPCGEPTERVQHCKPAKKECDDSDDDDGSGWWKAVAV